MTKYNNEFTHRDGVTLKEYVESRLNAIDKATDLARTQMESRLETMNEFRDQLNRQASTFVTTNEFDVKLTAMEKSRRDNISLVISLIALSVGILGVIARLS